MNVLPSVTEVGFTLETELGDIDNITKKIDSKNIDFGNIKATKEEIDNIIDKATEDPNYFKLDFPENYEVVKFLMPRECVNNITVFKIRRRKNETKRLMSEVNRILSNKCTQE